MSNLQKGNSLKSTKKYSKQIDKTNNYKNKFFNKTSIQLYGTFFLGQNFKPLY